MILLSSLAAFITTAPAQTLPQHFSQVAVATAIVNPTTMAFAPDGRIFVAQQNGVLIVIKNGARLSTPALRLTVNSSGERGLLGIAIHPGFTTNRFLYLYYTLADGSRNRVSRFTMTGDVINPASEVIILSLDRLSSAVIHNGGAMQFKGDKLYIAVGENANSAHAQNLDTYHGKLLRINPDGAAPTDNPFYTAGASEQRKRVWGYGLRNPYTFHIQPGTQKIFVNDVGQHAWEEINDATTGGLNFGWPQSEGATNDPRFKTPIFSYPHGSGDGRGCAITGGVFFNPASTSYPTHFKGKYFFQDLCNAWINYLDLSTGVRRNAFASGLPGQALGLAVGTDGNLYYLSRTTGTLYKVIYTENVFPTITDQPDNITVPEGQRATFQVTASGAAPLAYQWKKNGVNLSGGNSATYSIPTVMPSHAGSYQVLVSNSAGSVLSRTATLTVGPFNSAPSPFIVSPAAGAMYRAGNVIQFSGRATDAEDGALPASAFTWRVIFHHAGHVHDGPAIAQGVTSGSFSIPTSGETSADVFYRLHLTVIDSRGLSDTATVDIKPYKTTITLNSNPVGLILTLDGQPVKTPYSTISVEGMRRTIGATSSQALNGINYTFTHWTHGGAITQTIAIPLANTTYTANYSTSHGIPSPWQTINIGNVAIAGGATFGSGTFTLSGSGKDIWSTADAFRYVYQRTSGDVDIRARVIALTHSHDWAKAGIMIRESLQPNAKHAMVVLTPSKGVAFQRRTATGGTSEHTGSTGTIPYWVRLLRVGNTFRAYTSSNGSSWTPIGSASISMPSTVYVGLPVTGTNNNLVCTAKISNVAVTAPSAQSMSFGSTTLHEERLHGLSVFPNPVNGSALTIESTITATSTVRIQIVDFLGRMIHEKNLGILESGSLRYELHLSDLPKGVYVVRVLSAHDNRSAVMIRR